MEMFLVVSLNQKYCTLHHKFKECKELFFMRKPQLKDVNRQHADIDLFDDRFKICLDRVINSSNNGFFVVYREIINTRGVKSTFSQLAGGSLAKKSILHHECFLFRDKPRNPIV